jgi:hypothetical protein
MSKRTLSVSGGLLLCALLLSSGVLAMDSDNYQLDWFTPLTGGGGAASSDHYAINFTAGQPVTGISSGTQYSGCLGYWCGGATEYNVFLPLVLRNL